MNNIESYNSSYPLAYYEIGSVYSFYGGRNAKGTPANQKQIEKFAHTLELLMDEEEKNAIKPVKGSSSGAGYGGLNRFCGVVIDKTRTSSGAHIVVLLCNNNDGAKEFYTRKYAVNFGCSTDGRDLMPVTTSLEFESKLEKKVGGITLAGTDNKVGGVTLANGKNSKATGIGGITKASSGSSNKVGGITRTSEQRVGGITRSSS